MAFITSTPIGSGVYVKENRSVHNRRRLSLTPKATAVQPGPPPGVPARATSKPRPRASATIIDSRVASRREAHHWIVVKDQSRRAFERAAVAQADIAHQLEKIQKSGAAHRWVLCELTHGIPHPPLLAMSQEGHTRYLVTESFDRRLWDTTLHHNSLTRRWLSAVERVGPLISTVDIHSLEYKDVFTSKLHDVIFDPNANIVVLECINIKSDRRAVDAVLDALRAKAERSVAVGECLEFSILQSRSEPTLFKTVEVYTNDSALQLHMDGIDKKFLPSIEPHVVGTKRNRQFFKPVVFA